MEYNEYLEECRQLFKAFEKSQGKMLTFSIEAAVDEFKTETELLESNFRKMQIMLKNKKEIEPKQKLLFEKQILRLLKFLKELSTLLPKLIKNPPPEAKDIIFIFERQHLFKNIFKKHLADFSKI